MVHIISERHLPNEQRRLTRREWIDYWEFCRSLHCATTDSLNTVYSLQMIEGLFAALSSDGEYLTIDDILVWPTPAWRSWDVLLGVLKREFLPDDALHAFIFWCWDYLVVPRLPREIPLLVQAVDTKHRWVTAGIDYDEKEWRARIFAAMRDAELSSGERLAHHLAADIMYKEPLSFGLCTIWGMIGLLPLCLMDLDGIPVRDTKQRQETTDRIYIEMIMYLRSRYGVTRTYRG